MGQIILADMADDTKKKCKSRVKQVLGFFWKKHPQTKQKIEIQPKETDEQTKPHPVIAAPVPDLVKSLQRLEIRSSDKQIEQNEDDDEDDNFTFTPIKNSCNTRSKKLDSHSSSDSGFDENNDQVTKLKEPKELSSKDITNTCEAVTESFGALNIKDKKSKVKDQVDNNDVLKDLKDKDNKDHKKKKTQIVYVQRAPQRNRNSSSKHIAHPYQQSGQSEVNFNQVNRQSLSGGHVVVNSNYDQRVDQCLNELQLSQQQFEEELKLQLPQQNIEDDLNSNLDLIQDFINEEYERDYNPGDFIHTEDIAKIMAISKNMEQFTVNPDLTCNDFLEEQVLHDPTVAYLTPPRSVNALSPMSDPQQSPKLYGDYYYHSPADTSSTGEVAVFYSDQETYQDIPQMSSSPGLCDQPEESHHKTLERQSSSMNLKQFKDIQKDISSSFAERECCRTNKMTVKQVFDERKDRLTPERRKEMCVDIAKRNLTSAHQVLTVTLLNISNKSQDEDFEYVYFILLCRRVLSTHPELFYGDFALSLIMLAALRCYRHPFFTQYLVECVRTALQATSHKLSGESVFHEVDKEGEHVLLACARGGDQMADVLYWLVQRAVDQPPLFNLSHCNAEGYSALHVACKQHSVSSSRLHIVHVLLQHGHDDIWEKDGRGDSPVHLAVSSATCDLRLVLLLFKHVDQKLWKQLVYYPNKGSIKPMDYVRSKVNEKTRQSTSEYPREVLDFFKKCR